MSERSRLQNMIAMGMANESSRVASLIAKNRECEQSRVLALAAKRSQKGCNQCVKLDLSGAFIGNTINKPVPSSGSKLQSDTIACTLRGQNISGPVTGLPESARVAQLQQRTLDLSTDPNDADARFSSFRRPFIPICPPIPQFYLHAGEPVLQGKNCALPNKPDNPILPG